MSTPLRLVRKRRAGSTPGVSRVIDTMATGDAASDLEAGDSHLLELMEHLFAAGEISQVAWDRYCQVYWQEAARLREQEGQRRRRTQPR